MSGKEIVAYVAGVGAVTPISLATSTAGKPITVGKGGQGFIAITPDGKTSTLPASAIATRLPSVGPTPRR